MGQVNASKHAAYLHYFVHSPAEPKTECGYGCKAGHGAEIRFALHQLALEQRDRTAEEHELADRVARPRDTQSASTPADQRA